jgi:5'-3' exonuclease
MGIPSYYKKLTSSIKSLVVPNRGDLAAEMLLFDFNCMIYQVIRDPSVRPFPGYGTDDAVDWENEICQKIVDYTVTIWKELGKPKYVFIGIDGVVPMAKIRQQRLRRFKSIWTATEEVSRGLRVAEPNRWDTNAITPGTEFMERLGRRLGELCLARGWTLSDASEPGEGEQKCMAFWREHASVSGPIVIYGLDADLILLCLLTRQITESQAPVWLFREAAEWEKTNLGGFMRMDVNRLSKALVPDCVNELLWTTEYIAAMSLLGNDFVPHSLSIKIRDGGHQILKDSLRTLHTQGKHLVKRENGRWVYNREALLELCRSWATEEETRLIAAIKHKRQRTNFHDWNSLPSVWAEEEKVLCSDRETLWPDWEARMLRSWFGEGVTADAVCTKYAESLQWVLDYYTAQRPIDTIWFYPWSLPPSWSSWIQWLEKGTLTAPVWRLADNPLQAEEQLAMVLPLESWHFIRSKELVALPTKAPQFWPKSYGFFSAGRTLLWECEPTIPLLLISTIRALK